MSTFINIILIGVMIFVLIETFRFGWLVTKQRYELMEKPKVKVIYKKQLDEKTENNEKK